MSILTRKAVIYAKEEATYGTDPVPTTADGILASAPEITFSWDRVERDFVRDSLSPLGHVIGVKRQTLTFSTELKGANDSAAPATATHFGCLLKACALTPVSALRLPVSSVTGTFSRGETVTGGTSSATGVVSHVQSDVLHLKSVSGTFSASETVTGGTSSASATVGSNPMDDETLEYFPESTPGDMKSATLYFYADTILHKLTGARGTVTIDMPVGEYPRLSFTMTGFWNDPSDVTAPSGVTFEEHLPPRCLSAGLAVGSYSPVGVNAISLDLGNQVSESKDINDSDGLTEIFIPTRQPTGNIDPEVVALSSFNPFAIGIAGTTQEISWSFGSSDGNRVALFVPAAQLGEPGYQDRDGKRVYTLPFTPTGDDDEICLQVG